MKDQQYSLFELFVKLWSIIALIGVIISSMFYWVVFIFGVFILLFFFTFHKRGPLERILFNERITYYQRNQYGIFLSRFDFSPIDEFNRLSLFIIPRRNETAEQALIRYLPLVKGLHCNVFIFDRPKIRRRLNNKSAFRRYKDIIEAYQLFLIKTKHLEKIIIIVDIRYAHVAFSLVSQVPTAGIILDSTRKKRKHKRIVKRVLPKTQNFSFTNFYVSLVNSALTNSPSPNYSYSHSYSVIPPTMVISIKEPKIKSILRYKVLNLRMIKENIIRTALKVRMIDHEEELKSAIQFFADNLQYQNFYIAPN